MFRHLFVIFAMCLFGLCFSVPVVLAAESSELEKQIASFHAQKQDPKRNKEHDKNLEIDFANKVNRDFQSENSSLESFLGDSKMWDRLDHYRNNEEYPIILKVFTTETDEKGNSSGLAILVDKIQIGDTLEDLDSVYTQCDKFRKDLAEKEIELKSITDKINHIEAKIQEKISEELDKLQSNDEVIKRWKDVQKLPVVYKLTGKLFSMKYVDSLSGTSSDLLDSWQSAKSVIPSGSEQKLKSVLTDKVSATIQKEVKRLNATSELLSFWNTLKKNDPDNLVTNSQAVEERLKETALKELTGKNTEEILTKWETLTTSADYNAPSANAFQDELRLVVNKNIENQFPTDIKPQSSIEQFAYWTKLKANETFKETVSDSTRSSIKKALENQMSLAFKKEIPSFKDCDDCLAKWKQFKDNVQSFGIPSFSTKELVQDRLLELLPEGLQPRKNKILALLKENFPEFGVALQNALEKVQDDLDDQELAEWQNQLKGKSTLEIVQMWNHKKLESGLSESLKNRMKKASQDHLDVSFVNDLNDIKPAFENYITFEKEQKNGGTFDLALKPENLISLITAKAAKEWAPEVETIQGCENVAKFWFQQKETPFFKQIPAEKQAEMLETVRTRLQDCFVEDWEDIQYPSYSNYIAFLDKLETEKVFELDKLESQKEVTRESFAKVWKEELAKKSPEEIVSLWKSVQDLSYFNLLPKAEMKDVMASQFGICSRKALQTIKDCKACSDYWKDLEALMLKAGFKPSDKMNSMAVNRFKVLLDDSFPENSNENLKKLKGLKSETSELFHNALDGKLEQMKLVMNRNYLNWWKKHLEQLTCPEMLDEWKKNQADFRDYDLSLQNELKDAYESEFSRHFAKELKQNGQKSSNCISFWQNLLDHGFVPENEEEKQTLQIFKEVLDSETPSNLEEAQKFLGTTLQSVPDNSIFRPVLSKKLALVERNLAIQKEFQSELTKVFQDLTETPEGLMEFEDRIKKLETKYPEFAVYQKLRKQDQINLDSIKKIFVWNHWCDKETLTKEEGQTDIQMIPEWHNFTEAASLYDFVMNDILLKKEIMYFLTSTKIPHWSQYPYNGKNYYLTPSQIREGAFGIRQENYGDYSTIAKIENPSLIKDAYHHQIFNNFYQELSQISDTEIQQNPQVLYDFISNALNTLKTDKEIHPAYAAYGVCELLKAVQGHSHLNKSLETIFCVPQNRQLRSDFENQFDFNRFRKMTFFDQTDRQNASNFLNKCPIPQRVSNFKKPDYIPYRWVGFIDSNGNFLTGETQANTGDLLMLKNGSLVPAEAKSTGSLLFLHK